MPGPDYGRRWTADRDNVDIMRYEDLIANTAAILKATFSHVQEAAVVARDRGVGRVRQL